MIDLENFELNQLNKLDHPAVDTKKAPIISE